MNTRRAAGLSFLILSGLFLPTGAIADDRDLLRFDTAKPYLFILFDSSGSMNLSLGSGAVPANGDDPGSKLYQAKQAIHEVFSTVDDVQFGFASFNHDDLRVVAKHWLYYPVASAPAGWPVAYPEAATFDGMGNLTATSDLWVFGKHIATAEPAGQAFNAAAAPSLNTARARLNRFPKLEIIDNAPLYSYDPGDDHENTTLYFQSGSTYRMAITRPGLRTDGTPNSLLGEDDLDVRLGLERVDSSGAVLQSYADTIIRFKLVRAFLMSETAGPSGGGPHGGERNNGFWNWSDSLQSADCGVEHPFSGSGWEGNYDGSFLSTPTITVDDEFDAYGSCTDRADPLTCENNMLPTSFAAPLTGFPNTTPLDVGDVLPLHWDQSHKNEFLARFNPNEGVGTPNYGVADYFADLPDASGFLPLRNPSRPPLVGAGITTLAKSVNDFRCWYQGEGNKCRDGAPYPSGGWEKISAAFDDKWGCRRPYLIIVSDGDDTCGGENPCADTANLNSKSSVRTWVVAYGADCVHPGNPLQCLAQNGKGELVCPNSPETLKDELLKILGQIREETRSFASAAVPTVQAAVLNQVFVSTFTPLQSTALKPVNVWDGHINAFLKPLPIDPITKKPSLTPRCSTLPPDQQGGCFLWDAGAELKDQVGPDSGPFLGPGANLRRVFYSRRPPSGLWSRERRLLEPTSGVSGISRDLWDAFEIPHGGAAADAAAEARANDVITATLKMKHSDIGTTAIDYILGDIFHSDPIVIGEPVNTQYFLDEPLDDPDNPGEGDSYRDYFHRHNFRRKVLLVGSNDGMLHAFDAGRAAKSTRTDFLGRTFVDVKFDNGTGQEIFAFMPRGVMRKVRQMAENSGQQFTVDGSPRVADVFIDPVAGNPDDREWRTVVIGGLREGGKSYYALDVTEPDVMVPGPVVAGTQKVQDGFVPQREGGSYVPDCIGNISDINNPPAGPASCGRLPYPSVLWEFDDTLLKTSPDRRVARDEDGNGVADLGYTWSIANVGRIKVCRFGTSGAGCDLEVKYVAIFGGGMDESKLNQQGNFLYMLDIETGEILYKRALLGSAPSQPAAVDTDRDGYLDRIYIGTTMGAMYRVNIGPDSSGVFPSIVTVNNVQDLEGSLHTERRVASADWEPYVLFNASPSLLEPRPIYYPPTVVYAPKAGASLYALAFGAGDRENLWSIDPRPGRFYVILDDSDAYPRANLPLDETDFVAVDDEAPNATSGIDYLSDRLAGQKGWYLILDPNEKVITNAFSLSGITVFSTFIPRTQVSAGRDPLCARTGNSRVFVVFTTNGNGALSTSGIVSKYRLTNTFVTPPYDEVGQSRNPGGGTTGSTDISLLDADQLAIMQELQRLFPPNCRFGDYRIDIKAISGDTQVMQIAPIPVCFIPGGWKEE